MKRILLHLCCGPCGTATIKKLQTDSYEVIGYYYNPNIHPNSEYKKRRDVAKKYCEGQGIEFLEGEYEPKEYFDKVKGKEEKFDERCRDCWQLRLSRAAKVAKERGEKEFGSSLRISPYQNQTELLKIAKKIAFENHLVFYEPDLTDQYPESVKMSKKENMYRQKYCGCIFSKEYR